MKRLTKEETIAVEKLINQGALHYKMRQWKAGFEFFNKVLAIAPDHTYALQCVSQYYLMNGDYGNAKPVCLVLLDQEKLSNYSIRKLIKLAKQNHDDYYPYVLRYYGKLGNYEAIQKLCRDNRVKEYDAYLKMYDNYEKDNCSIPFNWYCYMIHNRINCNDLEAAKNYLRIVAPNVLDGSLRENDLLRYANTLYKYGTYVTDTEEQQWLISMADKMLESDPNSYYLLEMLLAIYTHQEREDDRLESIERLRKAYEHHLQKRYNKRDNKDVRNRIYLITKHKEVSDLLGIDENYESELDMLYKQKGKNQKF